VICIRTLPALVAYNDWEVEQLDVVTAFLEADVEEEFYIRQPEGFRHNDINGEERVCLLKKSLYGLKQAPRNWNTIYCIVLDLGTTEMISYPRGGARRYVAGHRPAPTPDAVFGSLA
jgi:hypothetical protein